MYNTLINLLAGGQNLPLSWGFPPVSARTFVPSNLRKQLMFLSDDDGRCQLIRWYHSIIRGLPAVWNELAQNESYAPSMMIKPCLESPTLDFCRDPRAGCLVMDWQPGPETSRLSGYLDLVNGKLELGGTYTVQVSQYQDTSYTSVLWPEFMKTVAGLVNPSISRHLIYFRPRHFNASAIAQQVQETCVPDLEKAGLLPAFLSLPSPVDKLAIAWQAVRSIEE